MNDALQKCKDQLQEIQLRESKITELQNYQESLQKSLGEAQVKNVQLVKEHAELCDQLSKSETEVLSWKLKAESKAKEIESLKVILKEVDAKLAKERSKVEKISTELEASLVSRTQSEELLQQSQGSKKLLEQTIGRLCAETSEKARLQQALQILQEKHKETLSQRESATKTLMALQENYERLMAENMASEVQVSQIKDNLLQKTSENEQLAEELIQLNRQHTTLTSDYNKATEDLDNNRTENISLQQEVNSKTNTISELQKQLSFLSDDFENTKDAEASLKAKVSLLEDRISAQEETISVLQACSHAKEAESANLTSQLEKMRNNSAKMESDREFLQAKVKDSEQRIEKALTEKAMLQRQCTELEMKLDKTEEDLTQAQAQLDQQTHSYERMVDISQSQNQRIIEAEDTVERAQKQLKKSQEKTWELQGLLDEKERALKMVRSLVDKLQAESHELDGRNASEIMALRAENDKLEKSISGLERQLFEEKRAVSLSRDSIQSLKSDMEAKGKKQQYMDFFVKLLKENLTQVKNELSIKARQLNESSNEHSQLNGLLKDREESLRLCHESIAQLYTLLDEKDRSLSHVLESSAVRDNSIRESRLSYGERLLGTTPSRPDSPHVIPVRSNASDVSQWSRPSPTALSSVGIETRNQCSSRLENSVAVETPHQNADDNYKSLRLFDSSTSPIKHHTEEPKYDSSYQDSPIARHKSFNF
eukprot:CAMPEP_0117870244 /NCGR_PEP_ID=MMETSP0950-20121206/9730_1 /TAXON_ID=44440 /ORGANISM="Chattonella subsalsa, Strain CCMP2191" /LENGTH=712 /DNA_ID=CAMNT_0005722505 /DNA_START=69 /DNA_END=2207 /DNA_ORIENTATION=-